MKNKILNVDFLFCLSCATFVFIYSLYLAPFATEGDQIHYRKIYEQIGFMDLMSGFQYYLLSLDSKEVVHFYFSWLFSSLGIPKNLFVAFFNSLLGYYSAVFFVKLNTSKLIAFLIITTSFYFNVLYFSAERLKFGFVFFVISMVCMGKGKRFYFFTFTSIMSHAQMLISYLSIAFAAVMRTVERVFTHQKLSKSLLSLALLGAIIAFAIGPHVLHKLSAYETDIKPFDLLKISVIMLLSIYYARNKREAFYIFIPLIIVVAIIGSDRVLMLGYFVFIYYGVQVNRGVNIGVLLTTIYFSLKSIPYLYNLIYFGNGFYRG
jgi:hypothetical protein